MKFLKTVEAVTGADVYINPALIAAVKDEKPGSMVWVLGKPTGFYCTDDIMTVLRMIKESTEG